MTCPYCKCDNPADAVYCGECGERIVDGLAFQETSPEGLADMQTRRTRGSGVQLLAPGEEFAGRYTIAAVIGEGGMGVVYRAQDKISGQAVALKLIRADRLGGVAQLNRLIREGVTSRDIRHPNVVAVYDVGEAGGQPYISMEHLAGQSLRAWNGQQMAAGAECSMAAAAQIVREILAGLEAAHAAGVIHRDLKPENVMLLSAPSEQGVSLKLLDFGIARVGSGSETGSTSLGTPRYMAPEQITAPDAAQASADLYSLSVIFYELLVGVVPQGHWQPPSGGRSDVPQGIDELIQRGLSNNPRSRPQDVKEYRRLLDSAMAAQQSKLWRLPIQAPGLDLTIKRWLRLPQTRKHWLYWAAGVAGVAVAATGLSEMGADFGAYEPDYVLETADRGIKPVQPTEFAADMGSPFTKYSGSWHDDFGNIWSVHVNADGRFSGEASTGQLAGAMMRGGFSDGAARIEIIGNGQLIGTVEGRLEDCHVHYQTADSWGRMMNASLHINHLPRGSCPW